MKISMKLRDGVWPHPDPTKEYLSIVPPDLSHLPVVGPFGKDMHGKRPSKGPMPLLPSEDGWSLDYEWAAVNWSTITVQEIARVRVNEQPMPDLFDVTVAFDAYMQSIGVTELTYVDRFQTLVIDRYPLGVPEKGIFYYCNFYATRPKKD